MRLALQHRGRSSEAMSLDERAAAFKLAQRLEDARALESGQLTAAEINRKNSIFARFDFPLDLASGGRLK